jgi:hypothetical protein
MQIARRSRQQRTVLIVPAGQGLVVAAVDVVRADAVAVDVADLAAAAAVAAEIVETAAAVVVVTNISVASLQPA